jgi:hypothetical protein
MIALGTARKRAGESPAAAFTRLLAENDSDMTTLAKAAEQLRVSAGTHGRAVRKSAAEFHAEAAERLDQYVELAKRDGENTAATHARLAREGCRTFAKLYAHLRACSDAAQ